MRVTGVPHPLGAPVVGFPVEHGRHPVVTLFDEGFVPVRPLSAALVDGEIVFTWLVREVTAARRVLTGAQPPCRSATQDDERLPVQASNTRPGRQATSDAT